MSARVYRCSSGSDLVPQQPAPEPAREVQSFRPDDSLGLRGTIERVTSKVFLLSPQNVNVTAEDKERIAAGGFFNQS